MITERQRKSIILTYRLTPAMARVFQLLLEVPMATNQMIEDTAAGDATPAKIIIYRLRGQLDGDIIIRKRNRAGYWLDDKTKEKILTAIDNTARSFLPAERVDLSNGFDVEATGADNVDG